MRAEGNGAAALNGVFAEGYAYDALGRRVSTTTADGTTRHVYDDNWQVIADIDEQGNVVASYAWGAGIDRLLAVRIGGANYYPLTDIQGTVWSYVDSANNVVARWQYDAWGNVVGEEVSVAALATLRYRFQGREWSAATGLVHFHNRWYDAETGRWLSKDPIRLSGGLNLYAFCGNDPVNCTDSLGLKKDNKKSGGSRGGSGGGNGDGGGSTPGDITLGDGGDGDMVDRINGALNGVLTGVSPTGWGEAAGSLDAAAIILPVLNEAGEMNNAISEIVTCGENADIQRLEHIEKRFRRAANAAEAVTNRR